jgi:DnaK suppressor protein
MTDNERMELRVQITAEISEVNSEIESLKELTKPIPPDNAIGRLTRMEAIQSKSINEAVLRKAKLRLMRLENAQGRVDDADYGICTECDEPIPVGRLKLMPESVRCVQCAQGGQPA